MIPEGNHTWAGELEEELNGNILPWWMEHAPDHANGGFHGSLNHQNQVVPGAGKGAVMHSRILWTFAAAHRIYPGNGYLDTARRAFDYLAQKFTDPEYGGIFWELEPAGEVRQPRKQIYALAFAIYGLVEYHLATGESRPLEQAKELYHAIEKHARDREMNGYAEALARDWSPLEDVRLSEKDRNENKTMNTHLHILEAYTHLRRAWKDPGLASALENLVELFLERFINPVTRHLHLFFNDRWELRSSEISYGHDIECAWLLHEAAGVTGKKPLVEQAATVAVEMAWANLEGLDADGGLFYEHDPSRGETDTDKHWWPQAEAMVGHYNAYQVSGEEIFARTARRSWDFIRERLIDPSNGEWYWSVDKNGVPRTEHEKAGFWKCPYHNGRACMELAARLRSK